MTVRFRPPGSGSRQTVQRSSTRCECFSSPARDRRGSVVVAFHWPGGRLADGHRHSGCRAVGPVRKRRASVSTLRATPPAAPVPSQGCRQAGRVSMEIRHNFRRGSQGMRRMLSRCRVVPWSASSMVKGRQGHDTTLRQRVKNGEHKRPSDRMQGPPDPTRANFAPARLARHCHSPSTVMQVRVPAPVRHPLSVPSSLGNLSELQKAPCFQRLPRPLWSKPYRRTLPSEGGGREFESRRAREFACSWLHASMAVAGAAQAEAVLQGRHRSFGFGT